MKKLHNLFLIFVIITTVSCKKDSNSTKSLLPGRCRISCTLNGAVSGNYNSDDYYSFSAYNASSMVLDAVLINNSTSIREDVSFLFPVSITTGNYLLSDAGAPNITFKYLKKNIYVYDDRIWNAGVGSDFTVNISKVSYNEIEGTFSGTATNSSDATTITITNGKFYTIFSH